MKCPECGYKMDEQDMKDVGEMPMENEMEVPGGYRPGKDKSPKGIALQIILGMEKGKKKDAK